MGKHKGPRRPPGPKKPPLTHFLCLPLVTEQSKPQLETSLKQFRDATVSSAKVPVSGSWKDGENGAETAGPAMPFIHPKAIRPVGALHCTLGVMSLNSDQLPQAVAFLERLDVPLLLSQVAEEKGAISNQPVPQGPLVIDMKGLESMHAPDKTSILYSAPTDPHERLYPFCLAVQKLFKDKGFLIEDDRKLKLHATIVNTIYAKGRKMPTRRVESSSAGKSPVSGGSQEATSAQQDDSSGHGPNANAPLKIDARAILDKYKDFVWADNVFLDRLALCEMGAKKVTDVSGNIIAEQYTEVASIPLPT